MKQFLKMTFASIIGVVVALAILIAIGAGAVAGLVAADEASSYVPKEKTILKLSLSGTVGEQTAEDNPLAMLLGGDEPLSLSLTDIKKAIQTAKEDAHIEGIYLSSGLLSAGSASLLEIRQALADFKQSGKFIVAYADNFSQGNYYVCSVADEVYMNPQGVLNLRGLASTTPFYKGLLRKIGVEMMIFKVGTYKGAVEPFMLDHLSEANREQINSYLSSIWGIFRAGISESRGVKPELIDQFANEGMAYQDAEVAVKMGLIDALRYESEVDSCLKAKVGLGDEKLRFANLKQAVSLQKAEKRSDNQIAILYAEGEIVPEAANQPFSSEACITYRLAKELIKLKEDKAVKAVVLRVNSPGGSAYISDQIWKEVKALKAVKPIVVSMGDVAASGGYYISCAANQILAEPNTLTGSIGIFGMFPNMTGLCGKIGLTTDGVKTHTFADLGDPTRPMTEGEKALIQGTVERGYHTFLSRCAEGRGMSEEAIDAIGQGRVWTGEQALDRGLVDRLGNLEDAVAVAAELADVTDYEVKNAAPAKSWLDKLLNEPIGNATTMLTKQLLGEDYTYYNTLRQVRNSQGVLARMPFDLSPQ